MCFFLQSEVTQMLNNNIIIIKLYKYKLYINMNIIKYNINNNNTNYYYFGFCAPLGYTQRLMLDLCSGITPL